MRRSFHVQCQSCHQIGLFASAEGVITCQWAVSEVVIGMLTEIRVLAGYCRTCVETGKVAI